MKVIFKEPTSENLTQWKKYKVISQFGNSYLLVNDKNKNGFYLKKRFDIVPSKKLKVGDLLLAKDLSDWSVVSENYFFDKWVKGRYFGGNRTIEKIDVKNGHKAFLVSNTIDVWVKYKGYRKFCERNNN